MNNPPRVHHFIPQFWIKRFAARDGKIWSYDWNDDRVRDRGSKAVMQIFNLYTVQPASADDTTLETNNLRKIDQEGNAAFDRVLDGDCSEATREDLATFLAAQIMRDPETVASYNPRAQALALSLLGVFDAPDYQTFAAEWSMHYPGASIREPEYDHIRSLGRKGAEDKVDAIITALDAPGGLPELPFTDLVRSASGQDSLRNLLLRLNWSMQTDVNRGFILGDSGVLYERRAIARGLKMPLSSSAALYLTRTAKPVPGIGIVPARQHEVDNLNFESSARARRWLVGEPSSLDKLKSQLSSGGFPSA
jgi:Protein of unknown function (DUF4238)